MVASFLQDLGFTVLMYAVCKGYTSVVGALLEHEDIDVNITSTKVCIYAFIISSNSKV